MDNLPTELETEPLAQKTQIVDANGNLIATLYDENRVNVPLSQVSPTMRKAIVAIEDSRFYEHGALDLGHAARPGHQPGQRAASSRAARRSPSRWSS